MNPISEFLSAAKDRARNPFFLTLIGVWIFRNWTLVYALFNFDENFTLKNKRDYFANYYIGKDICWEFLVNISITLLLMILAYILIVITRLLVEFVDGRIMPHLNSKISSKVVVDFKRYQKVEMRRDEYFSRLKNAVETEQDSVDELNKLRLSSNDEIRRLKSELSNNENKELVYKEEIASLITKSKAESDRIDLLKTTIEELQKSNERSKASLEGWRLKLVRAESDTNDLKHLLYQEIIEKFPDNLYTSHGPIDTVQDRIEKLRENDLLDIFLSIAEQIGKVPDHSFNMDVVATLIRVDVLRRLSKIEVQEENGNINIRLRLSAFGEVLKTILV